MLLLACMGACAAPSPDPNKEGSLTHLLSYSLVYNAPGKSSEASFVATLTNISRQNLKVQVNGEQFHSSLKIKPKKGDAFTVYDKGYRNLLMTSTWIEPVVELAPNKSVVWIVPIKTLLTLQGGPVTHESVQGCNVVSEMNMAVVPPDGNYIANNAAQTSTAIHIPEEGAQVSGGNGGQRR